MLFVYLKTPGGLSLKKQILIVEKIDFLFIFLFFNTHQQFPIDDEPQSETVQVITSISRVPGSCKWLAYEPVKSYNTLQKGFHQKNKTQFSLPLSFFGLLNFSSTSAMDLLVRRNPLLIHSAQWIEKALLPYIFMATLTSFFSNAWYKKIRKKNKWKPSS